MNPRENLKAYLDGELSASERTELELALAGDESLRKELSELEGLTLAVRAGAREFEVRGFEEVRSRLSRRRSRGVWWRTFGTVAVVGVLAAVLMPVFMGERESVGAAPSLATSTAAEAAPASATEVASSESTDGEEGFLAKKSMVAPSQSAGQVEEKAKDAAVGSNVNESGAGAAASAENEGEAQPVNPERDLGAKSKVSTSERKPDSGLMTTLSVVGGILGGFVLFIVFKWVQAARDRQGSGPGDSGSV